MEKGRSGGLWGARWGFRADFNWFLRAQALEEQSGSDVLFHGFNCTELSAESIPDSSTVSVCQPTQVRPPIISHHPEAKLHCPPAFTSVINEFVTIIQ